MNNVPNCKKDENGRCHKICYLALVISFVTLGLETYNCVQTKILKNELDTLRNIMVVSDKESINSRDRREVRELIPGRTIGDRKDTLGLAIYENWVATGGDGTPVSHDHKPRTTPRPYPTIYQPQYTARRRTTYRPFTNDGHRRRHQRRHDRKKAVERRSRWKITGDSGYDYSDTSSQRHSHSGSSYQRQSQTTTTEESYLYRGYTEQNLTTTPYPYRPTEATTYVYTDYQTREHPSSWRRDYQRRYEDSTPLEQSVGSKKETAAIHFEGDVSNISFGQPDYLGNGRLRNTNEIFKHWKTSRWARDSRSFKHNDGIVTIQTAGLYLIYSQVHYSDNHDTSGYRIYVNDHNLAQCVTSAPSSHSTSKPNTCFTMAVSRLETGDRVYITDLEPFRYSIIKHGHTFFGLVRLADI